MLIGVKVGLRAKGENFLTRKTEVGSEKEMENIANAKERTRALGALGIWAWRKGKEGLSDEWAVGECEDGLVAEAGQRALVWLQSLSIEHRNSVPCLGSAFGPYNP